MLAAQKGAFRNKEMSYHFGLIEKHQLTTGIANAGLDVERGGITSALHLRLIFPCLFFFYRPMCKYSKMH